MESSYTALPTDDQPQPINNSYYSNVSILFSTTSSRVGLIVLLGAISWLCALNGYQELTASAMHVFITFIWQVSISQSDSSVILCLLTCHIPIAMVVAPALALLTLTQSLQCKTPKGEWVDCNTCGRMNNGTLVDCDALKDGFTTALSGFSKQLSWLVVLSFHMGKAVETSRLGERISLWLVRRLGGSALGLGYAIFCSEILLAPFLPSNTARGGGIVMPVVLSLVRLFKSSPRIDPKMGQFLILCGSHSNFLSSCLYMTGTIGNPVVAHQGRVVLGVELGYDTWFLGASVPSLVCVIVLVPLLGYMTGVLNSKGQTQIQVLQEEGDPRDYADAALIEMGPLSRNEKWLCVVLVGCLGLWISGQVTGIPEALVAWLGCLSLVFMNVISWKDVTENASAWDAFFWLAGMILLSEQLTLHGISAYIGHRATFIIQSLFTTPSPLMSSLVLSFLYFMTMYLFSSITGHMLALLTAFLEAAKSLSCPPMVILPLFAYFSSLSGCLTHYSSGTSVIYFSFGFIPSSRWLRDGLIIACIYMISFFCVGLMWWKLLSFY